MNTFPDYVQRIETLEVMLKDDADFRDALKKQEWIILAAADASQDARLQILCEQLAELVRTNRPPDQIRLVAQQVVALWKDVTRPEIPMGTTVWLGLIASVATLLSFLLSGNGLISLVQGRTPQNAVPGTPGEWRVSLFESTIVYTHVPVLLILLGIQFARFGKPQGIDEPAPGSPEAALSRFRVGWIGIWASWLLAYAWLAIGYLQHWYDTHPQWMWCTADVFNAANGFFFFYCFLVLDEPSAPTGSVFPRRFKDHVIFVLAMAVIVAFLSIAGRLLPGSPLQYSGPFLLSCYTGLAMAYLIGRFDSHHMDARRLMLAPLYFYVMIQLTWVILTINDKLFRFDSTIRSLMFLAALLLKAVMFFVVMHWLTTGTVLKYLDKTVKYFKDKPLDVLRRSAGAGG